MTDAKLQAARKMRLVRRPDPRCAWVIEVNASPALRGEGEFDFACASCGTVLIASASPGLVSGIAVRCAGCGRYNEVAPTAHAA